MNILVAIDKLSVDGRTPSCIALNLRDSAPLFASQDCHITVCNLRGADPGADLLVKAGVPVTRTHCASASPRTLPRLLSAARQVRADLIHAHGYAAANYGRIAARRLGIPAVVHEHAILRVRPHQRLFDQLLSTWTARGIAISKAVADFMMRGRCIPESRIAIIPNGIDLARFRAVRTEEPSACRERFGWPTNALIAGSAARFRREKGLHVLVESAIRLTQERADLFFVLAGDGPDRAGLMRTVEQHGLTERIRFPGFLDDIPAYMRSMDLLVIPSLQEGLCFAAMEAMAAGTPLIASRTGGLPEIIEHEQNGLLVPPGDPTGLTAAMQRLLSDSELRRHLAENGKRRAESFAVETYVERIADLYRQLIPPQPASADQPKRSPA
jgi:glycosyltransferase involved in cell wall biosynthesis